MRFALFYLIITLSFLSHAGEADVIAAEVEALGGEFYRFSVTVKHEDEGWDHYVQSWQVLDTDGNVLGVRVLRHPHVKEQPFTRSATVVIPDNIDKVIIRAYDSVHHYGGRELPLFINKE